MIPPGVSNSSQVGREERAPLQNFKNFNNSP